MDLPERVAERFKAEALRRGISFEELVRELSEDFSDDVLAAQPDLGFIGMGSSSTGFTSDDIDEMLADGFGTN